MDRRDLPIVGPVLHRGRLAYQLEPALAPAGKRFGAAVADLDVHRAGTALAVPDVVEGRTAPRRHVITLRSGSGEAGSTGGRSRRLARPHAAITRRG